MQTTNSGYSLYIIDRFKKSGGFREENNGLFYWASSIMEFFNFDFFHLTPNDTIGNSLFRHLAPNDTIGNYLFRHLTPNEKFYNYKSIYLANS